jgi:hypothetical protein
MKIPSWEDTTLDGATGVAWMDRLLLSFALHYTTALCHVLLVTIVDHLNYY